jgi:hypothetical protein
MPGFHRRQGEVMRHRFVFFAFAWLACAATAQASDSLRVGNRLLMVGDTATHVQALLGRPSYRAHRSRPSRRRGGAVTSGNAGGERWQYRRDGRVIVVTLVDGVVTDIEDRPG